MSWKQRPALEVDALSSWMLIDMKRTTCFNIPIQCSMLNAQWPMHSMQFYEATSNTKCGDAFAVEIPKRDEKKRNREKIVVTKKFIEKKKNHFKLDQW